MFTPTEVRRYSYCLPLADMKHRQVQSFAQTHTVDKWHRVGPCPPGTHSLMGKQTMRLVVQVLSVNKA